MSKKKTIGQFITDAKAVHGELYDYSLAEYKNAKSPLIIICKKHGEFKQAPTAHLSQGQGCPQCGFASSMTRRSMSGGDFKKKANKVHGNMYDYDMVEYVNNREKVNIVCLEHGVFKQSPTVHLGGSGCPFCGTSRTAEAKRRSANDFKNDAQRVHGDKYDYSLVEYSESHVKVCIICRMHGEFWQTPAAHICNGQGCPCCNESQGEVAVAEILNKMGLNYEREKMFSDCRFLRKLRFDFYIDEFQIAIEYDGIQHFKPVGFGGVDADREFMLIKKRDKIKNKYCIDNKITLLRIPYFITVDTIEERIRSVLYQKSKISAQALGDELDEMVLKRLGPQETAKLL